MRKAFEKTEIKSMSLRNRIMRSATFEARAGAEGGVTENVLEMYTALARGGVGLIITGISFIRPDGRSSPRQNGIYKDDLIPGFKKLTEAVHKSGGAICMQIAHAGGIAHPALHKETPVGPSAGEWPEVYGISPRPREMTVSEIQAMVDAFGKAAQRVKKAGFDAVQLHGAHGYLLSQFLSPQINRRDDGYGGNVNNRARILYETYEAVRGAVGRDFPVMVKMHCQDFVQGGLTLEDSITIAATLKDMGLDALELSGGMPWAGELWACRAKINKTEKEAYFRKDAAFFKERLGLRIILVGGIKSPEVIEDVLQKGQADYVSMSRPFIREPGLVNRWASGDLKTAKCISCNRCFETFFAEEGVHCVVEKEEKTTSKKIGEERES